VIRILVAIALAYAGLLVLVWLFQERIAFPAPRGRPPDPAGVGLPHGERIELVTQSGVTLAGWFLRPRPGGRPTGNPAGPHGKPPRSPGLLWFYGNGENIAAIWPILREYQPPGAALLVIDYPGYGASGGRTTEAGLYEAAGAAYEALRARPEVDPERIYVYGRSLGSAVASYTAATYPVRGLILESPFTSAREMSRRHYGLFPAFIVRLGLDNLAAVSRIRCPLLVFQGTRDLLVPPDMSRRVAEAAPGPVELIRLEGAGHNDTYETAGGLYREKLWAFVR